MLAGHQRSLLKCDDHDDDRKLKSVHRTLYVQQTT